ncbi:taurine ABC transporter ATP-binding subunit [Trinickia sp. NRRL B-1857]|uniref:taurine ABC transporter ATP-binding subunit n=1 Tax=Trinickia sp. NRRL B-1857 TaxID=3162879 RepID=UPI003D2C0007
MVTLVLDRVTAQHPGAPDPVLRDISLSLSDDQLLVVLGPSGSGKTTLLNLIAGFAKPASGSITLDGRAITAPGAERGVVFQHDVLLPWQDVLSNVAFGLQLAGVPREERERQAAQWLGRVGLAGFGRRPVWTLSGGQKQRVGLARALATEPRLLLLDEPFGALDAFTREQMQTLLLTLWRTSRKPALLITHDIEEAVFLATDLVLLAAHPGRILERRSLDFARRYAAGEDARSIKSDPSFIAMREHILERVFAERISGSHV